MISERGYLSWLGAGLPITIGAGTVFHSSSASKMNSGQPETIPRGRRRKYRRYRLTRVI